MRKLHQRLVEAPPSVRWHLGRLRTSLSRSAFAGLGAGTVIVRPRALRGVDRIVLGAGCAVYEGAWLQAEGERGSITIGDRAYLGHDVHVHAIDPITIGDDVVLADGVFIASSDHGRTDRAAVYGTGPILVGDRVFVGQRAVVLGGVSIGDGATIGAGAVVTRDVPAGATAAGVPARVIATASVTTDEVAR